MLFYQSCLPYVDQRHCTGGCNENLLILPGHLPTSVGIFLASTGVFQLKCPFNSGRHQTEKWSWMFDLTYKISSLYVRHRFVVWLIWGCSSEVLEAWRLCKTCRPLTLFTHGFCGNDVLADHTAYLQMPVLKTPLCHVSRFNPAVSN